MKSLSGVIALMLALTLGIFNVVFASDKAAVPAAQRKALGGPDTATTRREAGSGMATGAATSLAQACKDKKPGIEVTVNGKKTKCPAQGSPAGIAVTDEGTPSDKSPKKK